MNDIKINDIKMNEVQIPNDDDSLHILLVEDNPTDVMLLEEALGEVHTSHFALTCVTRLDGALKALHLRRFDVVLLDLGLPDSQGFETFTQVQSEHPSVPILILSGLKDEELAIRAVQEGAQDFLVKGKINSSMLSRIIRYGIERKRSEQRLTASEVGYRRLFETTQDGIFILDAETGQITDANPFLEQLLGYSLEEFKGKRLCEIAPFRHKRANQAALETLKEKDHIAYPDLPLATKSGQFIDVEFTSNLYTAGTRRVIQCNIRDISARKITEAVEQELQRFLQSTLDALGSHIAVLTQNGEIVALNKAWREFSDENGGSAISCGVGANYLEVCDQAQGEWASEASFLAQGIRDIIAGEKPTMCLEYPCSRPDEVLWFNVCVTRFTGMGPTRVVVAHENITAHKRAEAAQAELTSLIESERQRAQNIVANLPGVVWESWGAAGSSRQRLNFVSDYVFTMVGYSVEEWLATPNFWLSIVHPDDKARAEREGEAIFASGKTGTVEYRWITRDGRVLWIETQMAVIHDEAGQSTGMRGVTMDITQRRQAEEERDRFFTMSLDMLCIADHNGFFKRLNPAFETTLGYSNAELMAHPFLELVHPDDHAATLAVMSDLDVGAPTLKFANRYLCRDGSYRWLSWVSVPYEGLIYAVAHDITSLKDAESALHQANDELELRVEKRTAELEYSNANLQSEILERSKAEASLYKNHEFLQAVLENTVEGIVACDASGNLTFFNHATRKFHGLPIESLPSEQWPEYYSLFSADGVTPITETEVPLFRALSGEHVSNVEMVIAPRHGSTRLVVSNGEPLFDSNGDKLGAVVVMHDITESKQIEVELQRAKYEADAANLAKSEFLSRMSHELRTPLNAILGFGQILERQALAPRDKENVGYILKGGRHLLDLINEVLDIARVEAGHMELSLEPIELREIVSEVCALMRSLAVERDISLNENVSQLGCTYIMADRQRFKQVLINLLANAIKFNHQGGRVEINHEVKASGWISVTVHDTGDGIAKDDLPKLFTPFERLNAANSNIEGTGLGLVLSQRLIAAMGGKISVESAPNQGTTFSVELPQAAPPVKFLIDSSQNAPIADGEESTEHTNCVLCIEDNLSNMKLIEAVLEMRPAWQLIPAIQGSIGLDLARRHKTDLILLDVNLPDINGKEVLSRLQQSAETKNIPVVVISADATPNQIQQLLAAGARSYLTKPLDVGQLLHILDESLRATPKNTQ